MFVHIGKNFSVNEKEIIGIFDMETSTVSSETRDFLKNMQDGMKTVSLCDDIPKTFVLCDNEITDTVYITQISERSTFNRINQTGNNIRGTLNG